MSNMRHKIPAMHRIQKIMKTSHKHHKTGGDSETIRKMVKSEELYDTTNTMLESIHDHQNLIPGDPKVITSHGTNCHGLKLHDEIKLVDLDLSEIVCLKFLLKSMHALQGINKATYRKNKREWEKRRALTLKLGREHYKKSDERFDDSDEIATALHMANREIQSVVDKNKIQINKVEKAVRLFYTTSTLPLLVPKEDK